MADGNTPAHDARNALLLRAAHCYRQATLEGDAARCYRDGGSHAMAAHLFEQVDCPLEAANCHVLSGQWLQAARCFRQAGLLPEAARCLLEVGNHLEAGWILAHELHQWERALAILHEVQADDAATLLALALARGRCLAGREPLAAARAVLEAVAGLASLPVEGQGRTRVLEWALAVAQILRRPDLCAALHGTATRMGISGAREQWEDWALSVFKTGSLFTGEENVLSGPEGEGAT